MIFYPQILTNDQKKILSGLKDGNEFRFYLAGGTAAALLLGHRTSADFDFYSREKFDVKKAARFIKKRFLKTEIQVSEENTLIMMAGGVSVSVFYYPYKLVKPLVNYPPIRLASPVDIAAMKIAAVIQRARQRDFVDLYYLIRELTLIRIIAAAYEKFPWYEENPKMITKALMYFEEADQDKEADRIKILDKNVSWEKVKKFIVNEVRKFIADGKLLG